MFMQSNSCIANKLPVSYYKLYFTRRVQFLHCKGNLLSLYIYHVHFSCCVYDRCRCFQSGCMLQLLTASNPVAVSLNLLSSVDLNFGEVIQLATSLVYASVDTQKNLPEQNIDVCPLLILILHIAMEASKETDVIGRVATCDET